MDEKQLARGLGWFSLGLGTAQVVSPGSESWRASEMFKHKRNECAKVVLKP